MCDALWRRKDVAGFQYVRQENIVWFAEMAVEFTMYYQCDRNRWSSVLQGVSLNYQESGSPMTELTQHERVSLGEKIGHLVLKI